jgi:tRNA dimethylallyltransferase
VLERLEQGIEPLPQPSHTASDAPQQQPLPALHFDVSLLASRIALRVERMLSEGLLEEVRGLLVRFPAWSSTASAAIGYAEALAVLRGEIPISEARERIAARTRQLAKRQRTWYRHRTSVEWIDGPADEADIPRAASAVATHWSLHGPHPVLGLPDRPPMHDA